MTDQWLNCKPHLVYTRSSSYLLLERFCSIYSSSRVSSFLRRETNRYIPSVEVMMTNRCCVWRELNERWCWTIPLQNQKEIRKRPFTAVNSDTEPWPWGESADSQLSGEGASRDPYYTLNALSLFPHSSLGVCRPINLHRPKRFNSSLLFGLIVTWSL